MDLLINGGIGIWTWFSLFFAVALYEDATENLLWWCNDDDSGSEVGSVDAFQAKRQETHL